MASKRVFIPAPEDLFGLKIQFVLFCINCKPRCLTLGHTDQKTATVGRNIAFSVKIIINRSSSGTIFYLFALSKAPPLPYSYKEDENEKIAFSSPTLLHWRR